MLTKRIIPCLDIKDGRTVKGVNFVDIRDAGDPIELAKRYVEQRADELVFLDITATVEKRKTLIKLVEDISRHINIPFTVGGGISNVEDVRLLLTSGADKVSVSSAAVRNPQLINDLANNFGSQCVVLSVDTKFQDGDWVIYTHGGRTPTDRTAMEWVLEAQSRGAGEVLLNSINSDGTKEGFSIDITNDMATKLDIPVIASGGAGKIEHFVDVFKEGKADAALAASIFHFGEVSIPDIKTRLANEGISVRK